MGVTQDVPDDLELVPANQSPIPDDLQVVPAESVPDDLELVPADAGQPDDSVGPAIGRKAHLINTDVTQYSGQDVPMAQAPGSHSDESEAVLVMDFLNKEKLGRNYRVRTDEQRRLDLDKIAEAIAISKSSVSTEADITEMAQVFGQTTENIRQALPEFKKALELSKSDPETFVKKNPILTDILLRDPNAGQKILTTQSIPKTLELMHAVSDWWAESDVAAVARDLGFLATGGAIFNDGDPHRLTPEEKAKRDTPTQVLELDTPEAQVFRAASTVVGALGPTGKTLSLAALGARRFYEGSNQVGLSLEGMNLLQADVLTTGLSDLDERLQDATANVKRAEENLTTFHPESYGARVGALNEYRNELKSLQDQILYLQTDEQAKIVGRINDLKLQPRLALGDSSGLAREVGAAAEMLPMTADIALHAAGGALAGGAIGLALGGPEGAGIGWEAGAAAQAAGGAAGATFGAEAVVFARSSWLEAGGDYLSNRETPMVDGRFMTIKEAAGSALTSGPIKGALEVLKFGSIGRAAGAPLAGLLRESVDLLSSKRLIESAPGLLSAFGKSFTTATVEAVGEGFQEAGQSVVEQVAPKIVESLGGHGVREGAILSDGEWVNTDDVGRAFHSALGLGVFTGGIGVAAAVGASASQHTRALQSARQAQVLFDLGKDPAFSEHAVAIAESIKRDSVAAGGSEVAGIRVNQNALMKFYQDEKIDGEKDVVSILGEDAKGKLAEAVSLGTPLLIPTEKLGPWVGSAAGQATRFDITTHAGFPTARDIATGKQKETLARAREYVNKLEAKVGADAGADLIYDTIYKDAIEAGEEQSVAEANALSWKGFYRTVAADSNKTAIEIFRDFPARIYGSRDTVDSSTHVSSMLVDGLPTKTLASQRFIDPISGLRNREGWDFEPRKEGKRVVALTTVLVKPVNDDPNGGHDVSNEMLARIGKIVRELDSEGARTGPEFLLHGDEADVERYVNAVQAKMPAGVVIDAAVGNDAASASAALGGIIDSKRRTGIYTPRGETPVQSIGLISNLSDQTFAHSDIADLNPNISDKMIAAVSGDYSPEQHFNAALIDKMIPGVWNSVGFHMTPERAWVAAVDLKAIRLINDIVGKDFGTELIQIIGDIAMRVGGKEFDFAHLSGDEFAAKHDSRLRLELFVKDFNDELRKTVLQVLIEGEFHGTIVPQVRVGIGEKTYGNADRVLNTAKRAEPKRQSVITSHAGVETRSESVLRRLSEIEGATPRQGNVSVDVQRGGDTQVRGPRADAGANQGQAFVHPVVDTNFDFGEPVSVEKATPEQIASARKWVERMKSKAKRKYATNLISFIEGSSSLVPEDKGRVFEGVGIELANAFGVRDPRLNIDEKGRLTYGKGATLKKDKRSSTAKKNRFDNAMKMQDLRRGKIYKQDPANGDNSRGFSHIPLASAAAVYEIFLNKNSDRSTLAHESAHVFLDILGRLANAPDATEKNKTIYASFLEYVGAESMERLEEKHHEKFAVGFEQYLANGEAPTPELQTVFSRFKYWLLGVYRSVKSMLIKMPPDIKALYDRLLATQDEIDAAQGRRAFAKTAAEAGLSEIEWEAYKQTEAEELEYATKRAWLAAAKESLRASGVIWKEAIKEETLIQERAYEDLPARKAELRLRNITLDEAAVLAALDKSKTKRFDLDKKDGILPDDVAVFLGFETGKEMLRAVSNLKTKDEWVKERAESIVSTQFPGILEDQKTLRDQIEKDMLSFSEQKILRNWALLSAKAPKGSTTPMPVDMLRESAKEIVRRRTIKRMSPGEFLTDERSAAKAKAEAGVRGHWQVAQEKAKEELLNAFAYHEMLDAVERRDRLKSVVLDMASKKSMQRLAKADEALYLTVRDILAALKMSNTEATELGHEQTVPRAIALLQEFGYIQPDDEWAAEANPKSTPGLTPVRITEVLRKGDWRELTVVEMDVLSDALTSIRDIARSMTQVIAGEQKAELDFVSARMIDDAKNSMPAINRSSTRGVNFLERIKSSARGRDGSMLSLRTMFGWLAGGDLNSYWYKAGLDPLQDSKVRSAELTHEHLDGLFKKIEKAKKLKSELNASFNGKEAFPNHKSASGEILDPPSTMAEIFVMALHMGSESNFSKLTVGRNITVQEVIAATNQLSKEAWDVIQEIWDSAETVGQLAFELEKRDRGVVPKRIKAIPVSTRHGIYRGGYFAIGYDTRVTKIAREKELEKPNSRQISTAQGHFKERNESFNGVVSLEIGSVAKHFQRVIHDIAFRESLRSVSQLILRDDVRAVIAERLGDEVVGQFETWLKDIATQQSEDVDLHAREFTLSAKSIKSGVVMSSLGYSIPTALGDLSMFGTGLAAGKYGIQDFAGAMAKFFRAPHVMIADVFNRSPEFRTQRFHGRLNIQKTLDGLGKSSIYNKIQWLRNAAFVLFDLTYAMTAAPTWVAAYENAFNKGMPASDATRYADNVLLQVFPSHNPVDQAAILRDKGLVGALTMMYSFWNSRYNMNRDIIHYAAKSMRERESDTELLTKPAIAVASIAAISLVAGVASEVLTGRGPEEGDDDPTDPGNKLLRWINYAARKMLGDQLSQFPGGNEVAGAVEARMLGKAFDPSPKQLGLASVITNVGTAIWTMSEKEEVTEFEIQKLVKSLSVGVGVPMNQPWRTADFIYETAFGSLDPDFLDYLLGPIYGPHKLATLRDNSKN